ncbi:hypothetical protein CMV_021950 [Castanea mollissima]|uniref:Uncharacterized protein n=1 Tax=Castanea mollissima TaxID=60419 RepID=A0A8J4QJ59_9ROSI|nr:hypothetical protein CMV_021950 [Castanea mollissima]
MLSQESYTTNVFSYFAGKKRLSSRSWKSKIFVRRLRFLHLKKRLLSPKENLEDIQEKKNLEETREKHSFESQILRNTAIKPEIQYASSSVHTGLDSQSSSDENIPVKKYYYVIYDEPYQGIFTNEFEALRIIQGNPGNKHRKFSSGIEVEGSLAGHKSKRIERNSYLRTLANEPVTSEKMVSLEIKFHSPEE